MGNGSTTKNVSSLSSRYNDIKSVSDWIKQIAPDGIDKDYTIGGDYLMHLKNMTAHGNSQNQPYKKNPGPWDATLGKY